MRRRRQDNGARKLRGIVRGDKLKGFGALEDDEFPVSVRSFYPTRPYPPPSNHGQIIDAVTLARYRQMVASVGMDRYVPFVIVARNFAAGDHVLGGNVVLPWFKVLVNSGKFSVDIGSAAAEVETGSILYMVAASCGIYEVTTYLSSFDVVNLGANGIACTEAGQLLLTVPRESISIIDAFWGKR
jgi:hypothetical protein